MFKGGILFYYWLIVVVNGVGDVGYWYFFWKGLDISFDSVGYDNVGIYGIKEILGEGFIVRMVFVGNYVVGDCYYFSMCSFVIDMEDGV